MSRTMSLVLVVVGVILAAFAGVTYFLNGPHLFDHQTIVFGALGIILLGGGVFGMMTGNKAAA